MAYIPIKPIPIRERASIAFVEHGRIDGLTFVRRTRRPSP